MPAVVVPATRVEDGAVTDAAEDTVPRVVLEEVPTEEAGDVLVPIAVGVLTTELAEVATDAELLLLDPEEQSKPMLWTPMLQLLLFS